MNEEHKSKQYRISKTGGCLFGIMAFLASCFIGIIIIIAIIAFFISGSIDKLKEKPLTSSNSFKESFHSGNPDSKNKIALIKINGIIINSDDTWGTAVNSNKICDELSLAVKDKNIKAVILDINSPGGEITATDKIYHYIQKVRKANKPVISIMESVAASGGYYVAAGTDYIIANRLTTTGSIGVIVNSFNFYKLLEKIKVGIIGASGYSGEELIRLIVRHPKCELKVITSRQYSEKLIGEVFPRFGKLNYKFTNPDIKELLNSDVNVFFLALPHKVASEFAVPFLKSGKKVIDISADFRLNNIDIYKEYYKTDHSAPELLKDAVYGLPEFNRSKMKNTDLIACPGCYPTSILLPSLPLIKENLIYTEDFIICSGSGVSGAGRKVDLPYIFPECNESFRAYAPVGHRHTPEIEQELSKAANKKIVISFIPHLVPMNRGMNSTIILKLKENVSSSDIYECYRKYYSDEEFVRVLKNGKTSDTKDVVMSNVCEIGFAIDKRTGKLIVTSCIDNLTKGASGQAVQCMNIMFGIEENIGLI